MSSLKINDKAPDFSLRDKDGKLHSLKSIKSKYTIIYFYPKDNTPGCTREAIGFANYIPKFSSLNTKVIGISGGDNETKKKFCEKHNLKITLLSDPDFKVSKKYKVYQHKSFAGKHFLGIVRTTYVLDQNKKIIKIYSKVKPEIHPEEVLNFIKTLENIQ
ncbi:MAG: peroxiredoxin [Nanoarchaeota archaeon]